jgi:hypothetical protein
VSQVPRLRPYSGHRLERIRNLGRAWTQTDQDTDAAGLCSYEFNSLGFRGPEFDAQAEFTVFVFGESDARSEEHRSELQSLSGSSYAVFCLKKNN